MSKKNSVRLKEGDNKKSKKPVGRLSVHIPTPVDVARAMEAKEPTVSDLQKILSLKPEEVLKEEKPIRLSDDWYEFSVFFKTFHISKGTANRWLQNGWLAYSLIGKIRIINKADIEEMMLHFRRPSIWCSLLFLVLNNTEWFMV